MKKLFIILFIGVSLNAMEQELPPQKVRKKNEEKKNPKCPFCHQEFSSSEIFDIHLQQMEGGRSWPHS